MGDLGDVMFASIYIKLFTQSEKTIKLMLEEHRVNTVRIRTGHPVSLLSLQLTALMPPINPTPRPHLRV
jgi:hypothetical protein